jgi:hypothetical protein
MIAAWACAAQAQSELPQARLKIDFPADSPVAVVAADWGESRAAARGNALMLDLKTSLVLRNTASQRIRGVVLRVVAQEVSPGGKASVAVPSLNVAPGETFPVRVDLRLLRPPAPPGGPLVEVSLDGVLFEDLSFYGPDRLESRRAMLAWELEAQRDRAHFKKVLETEGEEGLRRAMLDSLARQAARPRLDVQVVRRAPPTAFGGEQIQFAFLRFPGAPVEPISGTAEVAGNEARTPRVEFRNVSAREIRYLEIGWIVRDRDGREFFAGSLPASGLKLAPGAKARTQETVSLRFASSPGRPLSISGMTGFVSQVEFADGSLWIPPRKALSDPRLARVVAPSAEEQRLAEIYRTKGLAALIAELKKF